MPKIKVNKKQFIEVLENNIEGRPDKELAVELNISAEHFSKLKWKWRNEIRDAVRELAKKYALNAFNNLRRNSLDNADTPAAKILLEMADAYINKSEIRADVSMGVIQVPESVPVGAPVPEQPQNKSSVEDDKNGD